MLRTLIVGAIAAFAGSKLLKMNDEGKLDSLKDRARDGADRLRDKLANQEDALIPSKTRRQAPPPAPSSKARLSPSDDVSKPARAHPWPIDERAMPKGN